MMLQEGLSLDDLLLIPQYSDIRSRKTDVDITTRLGFGGISLPLPIISSPMNTITEDKMSCEMSFNEGMGIIHRYNTIEDQINLVDKAINGGTLRLAAAVGISGDFLERTQELLKKKIDILCLDVAHGHSLLMKEALEKINSLPGREYVHIMAGNVATGEGFIHLYEWGANSIRVGIGGGSICSTRIQTGFGVPNASSIMDCMTKWNEYKKKNQNVHKPGLIIDGGIKNGGDIVKALALGADAVMVGSLLSGTDETPGQKTWSNKFAGYVKEYNGMASKKAQQTRKDKVPSAPEGISTFVPYRGPVKPILESLKGNIQSGFSYCGARDILELRDNAQFIKQTNASQRESNTHILEKGWLNE